jgi:nicotinic acid mononucleotide adenylyltransferase
MSKVETHYDFSPGDQPVFLEEQKIPRIGVYAAGFDPVHAGHIIFALKAQKLAGLERIYFVPERRPRRGTEPEHYVHRSVMLRQALKPYAQFDIFDLPDAHLTQVGLNRVLQALPQTDISLLTSASDLLWHDGALPSLYHQHHIVIAVTSHPQMAEVLTRLASSETLLGNITFVDIGTDHISSQEVRHSIRTGMQVRGVLPSVWRYARQQWLYIPPIRRG